MLYTLFKPNAKETGSLFSFEFNSEEKGLFIKAIKQDSWDAKRRTGSFGKNAGTEQRGVGNITVKFNLTEAGAFLAAFRNGVGFEGVGYDKGLIHDWNGEKTQIFLNHGDRGHILNITKDGNKFFIGITPAEAAVLAEIFARFIIDVAKQEAAENREKWQQNSEGEGQKTKRTNSRKPSAKKQEPEPEEEPFAESEFEDDDVPF